MKRRRNARKRRTSRRKQRQRNQNDNRLRSGRDVGRVHHKGPPNAGGAEPRLRMLHLATIVAEIVWVLISGCAHHA
jgi:hypothetical protein